MIFQIFGYLSVAVFLLGDIPYVIDTIKKKTQPHRVTWFVATLVNGSSFANQLASGANNSLWILAAATLMTGTISVLSIKYGTGGHSKLDITSALVCLAGLGLWWAFESPWLSIIANAVIGTVGLLPTYAKTRKNPDSETGIAWVGGTLSAALAAISVGRIEPALLVLPIIAAITQGYMIYLIYLRPKRLQ